MSLPILDAFVTGTDTGVGKTVVCARMAAEARARGLVPGVLKAVQTGEDDDAMWVASHVPGTVAATVYHYESPLAPALAARADDEPPVDIRAIVEAVVELRRHCDGVIVEGSGGLLEPLADRLTFADLAVALELPVIIVCPPGRSCAQSRGLDGRRRARCRACDRGPRDLRRLAAARRQRARDPLGARAHRNGPRGDPARPGS